MTDGRKNHDFLVSISIQAFVLGKDGSNKGKFFKFRQR